MVGRVAAHGTVQPVLGVFGGLVEVRIENDILTGLGKSGTSLPAWVW